MPTPSARVRRLVGPALAAAVALLPAACSLDSDNNAPQLVQQWVLAEETAPPPGTPPTVQVEGGAAIVSLAGEFVRTCTAGTVNVTHTLDAPMLVFRATFTPAASCSSETATRQFVRYFAYLTRVPIGTYQVRVVHENDDLVGGTGTAHEETITVF